MSNDKRTVVANDGYKPQTIIQKGYKPQNGHQPEKNTSNTPVKKSSPPGKE